MNWITEAREAHQGVSCPPDGIREFLLALQARNEKDNGLFPQVASEVEADAKALRRVLAVLDFYHPPRTRGVSPSDISVPPAIQIEGGTT